MSQLDRKTTAAATCPSAPCSWEPLWKPSWLPKFRRPLLCYAGINEVGQVCFISNIIISRLMLSQSYANFSIYKVSKQHMQKVSTKQPNLRKVAHVLFGARSEPHITITVFYIRSSLPVWTSEFLLELHPLFFSFFFVVFSSFVFAFLHLFCSPLFFLLPHMKPYSWRITKQKNDCDHDSHSASCSWDLWCI